MGYMRHHTIVVSGWRDEDVEDAHQKALEIFGALDNSPSVAGFDQLVTPIIKALANGVSSFAVMPDGSKEWWDTSNQGDLGRQSFIAWMREGPALDWVEVQFGDDDHLTFVTAHSDEDDPSHSAELDAS